MVKDLATETYSYVYLDSLKKEASTLLSGTIFAKKKKVIVTISLPPVPKNNDDCLYTMYIRGVINWEDYCRSALRGVGLPINIMKEPPKPTEETDKNINGKRKRS